MMFDDTVRSGEAEPFHRDFVTFDDERQIEIYDVVKGLGTP
jgi:hypothetical protein